MTMNDFFSIFQWWAILFILGLVVFPYTGRLFSTWLDKGYIFSKLIGLAVVSYLLFVFGELHILPFSSISGYIILAGIMVLSLVYFRKTKQRVYLWTRASFIISLLEELLFSVGLYAWSYVRATQSTIDGLEKYMDFGFVNSILRSTYFPPRDMWYTPDAINYYYFGHLMTAVITKLSQLPSSTTFNLMIATLFAFCFTGSFALGIHFLATSRTQGVIVSKRFWIRIGIGGVLSGLLVTCAGNLHMLYGFFKAYPNETPLPFTKLAFQPLLFPNAYWYPNATRFIYHTIHEFPIYSFVVSDLHGHVIDIPFVLLTIALLFIHFRKKSFVLPSITVFSLQEIGGFFISPTFLFYILLGFFIAIMYMTNALDGLIYLLLTTLVVGYKYMHHYKFKVREWTTIGIYTFRDMFIIGMCFFLFSLPFSLFFTSFVSQVGIMCAPEFLLKVGHIGPFIFEPNHCQRTPVWQLGVLYGFFYFWVISLIYFFITSRKAKKILTDADMFIAIMVICASILILIPEFAYLKDIYGDYYRANTMFKLVYQAFIMLGLSSSYIIVRTISSLSRSEKLVLLPYFLVGIGLVFIVLLYPYFAITSYYNGLKEYKGLNGTSYLQTLYPSDAMAIYWINSHISGQPVMLEAQGDSYTDYERVSANTGLPTVLGWSVHEWLWHNTYDVIPPRASDVQTIYETTDVVKVKQLIAKYHITYIFVGKMENEKYKVSEDKFTAIGKIMYHKDSTTIYQVTP